MYGEVTCREPAGRTGATLHSFSHGNSVKANQIASTRPERRRKDSSVRPPEPGAANSSRAGTSVRLTQRRVLSGPTRSTASVTKDRPRWVSSAAQSASSRRKVRST